MITDLEDSNQCSIAGRRTLVCLSDTVRLFYSTFIHLNKSFRPFLVEQEIGNLYSLHFLPTIQVYDGYAKTILFKNGYPMKDLF